MANDATTRRVLFSNACTLIWTGVNLLYEEKPTIHKDFPTIHEDFLFRTFAIITFKLVIQTIDDMTKVINVKGAVISSCDCDSWLAHWKKYSGLEITYCPVGSCLNKDLVGAFVRKYNSPDQRWYIVPLCREHVNASSWEVLDVAETPLILHNKCVGSELKVSNFR